MAKPYAELRQLRKEMGYSIAEMAQLMGKQKSTYQGYETPEGKPGHRKMPAGFINSIREWQQIDLEFFAELNNRVDDRWKQDGFPPKILSVIPREAGECHD